MTSWAPVHENVVVVASGLKGHTGAHRVSVQVVGKVFEQHTNAAVCTRCVHPCVGKVCKRWAGKNQGCAMTQQDL